MKHTFAVNHHGDCTVDVHLVWDEVSKAAYRAHKAWELVAATEIAELRIELEEANEELKQRRQRMGEGAETTVPPPTYSGPPIPTRLPSGVTEQDLLEGYRGAPTP